ncbi:hypothetical protein JW964_14385 [candidate division KSB1 bacterium]|nr:hypothetical protein [candidate division KSB1 bacterium]
MFNKSLFLIAIIFLFAFSLFSQPQVINYQGVLTNAGGTPLNGNFSIVFSIYTVPGGGVAAWSETQTVAVNNGHLNVLLGVINPIPYTVFNGPDKYLGVKVGSDPEMTPRKRLVSVGYAFTAHNADMLDNKNSTDFVQKGEANSISSGMIAGNAVTTNNITPNIVSSLDGVVNDGGNIDLIAGAHVTITPDDANNRITISADGGGIADNLGNHIATQNIRLNNHYLSNDGGNEGIRVDNSGNVTATATLNADKVQAGGTTTSAVGIYGRGNTNNAAYFEIPSGSSNSYNCLRATSYSSNLNSDALEVYSSKGNALDASSAGTQPTALITNTGTAGVAARLRITNSTNAENALEATTSGTGNAAYFYASNVNSTSPILEVATNSKGNTAYFHIDNTTSTSNCLRAISSSTNASSDALEVRAQAGNGLQATSYGSEPTIYAYSGYSANRKAGYFYGNVQVTGSLSKGSGSFMIDHPLDPANKYLCHSFVESPDMMNVYNGNIVLDANGEATVEMPEWFSSLNNDFRYQLTTIGGFAPVYIAEEMANNRFKIAGGKANMKVSWQVTGIRQDAFAKAHRIQVEVEKEANERGKYLYPTENGVSETLGMEYEKNQERIQQEIKDQQEKVRQAEKIEAAEQTVEHYEE